MNIDKDDFLGIDEALRKGCYLNAYMEQLTYNRNAVIVNPGKQ